MTGRKMAGEVRVKDDWIQKVVVPKDWDLKFNRLPEWDFSKETEKERMDVFDATSPQGVIVKVWWDPSLGPKGLFSWSISKKGDLDDYYKEHRGGYARTVCSRVRIVVNELSGPDWRKALEIYAERKYTIVGDRVFYRDEQDGKVLVCIDKGSRKEVFRKNLVGDRIWRIEKHPNSKGIFLFFDAGGNKDEDYERMKRTNLGFFDLNGNIIWWAQAAKYTLIGGAQAATYTYTFTNWMNEIANEKEAYAVEYGPVNHGEGQLCIFDMKNGKLKELKQISR